MSRKNRNRPFAMVQKKSISVRDAAVPSQGMKAAAYKNPALDKIHQAILAIERANDDPAQSAQSVHHLCALLLENIALPARAGGDNAYGRSFPFKTHLALILHINRLLQHSVKNSRRIRELLNSELLESIRRHRGDTVEKNRYMLLFWMLKFPLIEHALKRKRMCYKEDLYQGSYAVLSRCVEKCDPGHMDRFDAYYTKALLWNLPRLMWQIKNRKEIPLPDRGARGSSPGTGLNAAHDDSRAAQASEDKKEIIDNLLYEWWQKVRPGVKKITGETELSCDALAAVLARLKGARAEKTHLFIHSRMNELMGENGHEPAQQSRSSVSGSEAAEFVRYGTILYIAYRMLKHGTRQAQIARELNLSRERIRQYVQTWIRPYIKTKIKKVGLATARYGFLRDYQRERKQYRTARVLLRDFLAAKEPAAPPPLITRVNPGKAIKLFNLNIRCPEKTVMPGQLVRIAAEPYGREIRLIMSTYSHKERMGWCLVHWDDAEERLVSSSNKITVSLIPFKMPEEKVLTQVYRHYVKAVRKGLIVQPPEEKLKVKTSAKYPAIAITVFGRSSALYLNLTNAQYLMSIIGVQAKAPEKSLLVKFEAVERQGHVEFKQILLSGTDQWHYRALIAKKDAAGNDEFYYVRERNSPPVRFEYPAS